MVGSTSLVLIINIKELGGIQTRGQKRLFERKSTMENSAQLMKSFLCPRTWITTQFNWVSTINGAFDGTDMHGRWDASEVNEHPRQKKRPVTGGSLGGAESSPLKFYITLPNWTWKAHSLPWFNLGAEWILGTVKTTLTHLPCTISLLLTAAEVPHTD